MASNVDMEKAAIWLHAVEDMELNEWEQGFVTSCSDWVFNKEGKLSDRQYATLEKIYRKFF